MEGDFGGIENNGQSDIDGPVQHGLNHEEMLSEAKNFFDSYKKELLAQKKEERVVHVNFGDLVEHSPMLAENIIAKPEETLQIRSNRPDCRPAFRATSGPWRCARCREFCSRPNAIYG